MFTQVKLLAGLGIALSCLCLGALAVLILRAKAEPLPVDALKPTQEVIVPSDLRKEPNNIQTVAKITCNDEARLPVWKKLLTDSNFRSHIDNSSSIDCLENLEISEVDLNQDGTPEFVVRGLYSALCGATGNCGLWIFRETSGKLTTLLSTTADIDFTADNKVIPLQFASTKTRAFLDLETHNHFTGYETMHHIFKYNGSEYVDTRCRVEEYHFDGTLEWLTCRKWEQQER